LPKIFGHNLSDEILVDLLLALDRFYAPADPERALAVLRNLLKINRFDTLWMFLKKKDKEVIRNILGTISSKGAASAEESTELLRKYEL